MKKIAYLLSVLAAVVLLPGCTCYLSTAGSYPVETSVKAEALADLEVSPKRISYTYNPTREEYCLGIQNVINVCVENALKANGNADVLVAMRYYIEGKRCGINSYKVYEVTVTGFPAFYKNFRPVTSAPVATTTRYIEETDVSNSNAVTTRTVVVSDNPEQVEAYPSTRNDASYKYVIYNGDYLKSVPETFEGDFIVENGTEKIGKWAFMNCNKIASIRMPDSVVEIEKEAFSQCHNLNSIVLSANLRVIGDNAFEDCRNLRSITLPYSLTKVGKNAFNGCSKLTALFVPKDRVKYYEKILPSSVTNIIIEK